MSVLQRLVAEGHARAAQRSHHDLPAPVDPPAGAPSSEEVLDELRMDRA